MPKLQEAGASVSRPTETARILMVPPRHYSVLYEINPWMNRQIAVSATEAGRQWTGLYETVTRKLGAEVLLAEPEPGLPDMVFTANAGLVFGDRVVLSNFRHPERQGEREPFRRWFTEHGFRVVELPEELTFEGEGDALFAGDTLLAGYFWRSDVRSHAALSDCLGVQVLSLQLVDPYFYHLDTCLCVLDPETVAYVPGAFDEYAQRVIEANVPHRIVIQPDEARRFAANALVLGRRVALNTGCPQFEAALREHDFEPYATQLDEFLKAGGSAKCLTLHLDRDQEGGCK
jgi:N-dimethylarginine dimethylaminohydrolase